jgi:Zn-finger nucleic acid-binding protein
MVVERQHGVAVDVCRAHGVWLDLGELPALVQRVKSGARVGMASALADAREEGMIGEALLGLWSFVFL